MKSIIKTRKVFLMLFAFHLSLVFILAGCGYKPSSSYAKKKIQGNVYVHVVINLEDPKNSVLVKDALNEIVVGQFNNKLVSKRSLADTILTVKLGSVGTQELQKDEDGYVNLYRTNVSISVIYEGPNTKGSTSVSGSYDFSIDEGSSISDTKRFEAIKIASFKALTEIVSKFAIESFKKDETKVFVGIDIESNSSNALIVKNTFDEILVDKLDNKFGSNKSSAELILQVKLKSANIKKIETNEEVYLDIYKSSVEIRVEQTGTYGLSTTYVSGSYTFSIDSGSTVSEEQKKKAIKIAATRALNKVISVEAIESFKKDKTEGDENKTK